MSYARYSDETLLELIAAKDSLALEELYDRHTVVVHGLVVRIVNNRAIADEIVQETFWQAWQKAKDFKGRGAGAAWLYRIARNKSIDVIRKQKKRPIHTSAFSNEQSEEQPHLEIPADEGSFQSSVVERVVAQHLDRQQLSNALAAIPTEQRTCLEMSYFEGFSQSQISKKLEIPLGTVKTRVRMGLNKLEHILRSVGYNEENF